MDGAAIEIVKAFAKSCQCTVLNEPNDADYVVVMSHHDLVFGPKLGEKKFVVIKVDVRSSCSKVQFAEGAV